MVRPILIITPKFKNHKEMEKICKVSINELPDYLTAFLLYATTPINRKPTQKEKEVAAMTANAYLVDICIKRG